jgi:hypothetical protein
MGSMFPKMFYSTMYLGHGASGSQRMFTIPEGQSMAMMTGAYDHCASCGRTGSVTQTREHTNMSRAGVLGVGATLTSMRAVTHDGSTPELGYEVLVGSRQVLGGSVRELLNGPIPLPGVEVEAEDTFEVVIAVPPGKALERPEIVSTTSQKVRVFKPVAFGLGRDVWVDDLVRSVTRPPLFLKIEFWAK